MLLLSLSLVAAACGGSSKKSSTGGSNTTGTAAASGKPVSGGSITYGLEAETNGGFCLQEAQLAAGGYMIARSLYDTLTAPDENGKIQPFLAKAVDPNADFTVWTITLRDGVKFSDGTALDAQIVADNLNAYIGKYPKRHPTLTPFVFSDVDSVAVGSPTTVVVKTKRPWVAFPWFLWFSSRIGIIGRSQLDGDGTACANKLVGTGPFVLDHWTVNQELVANKNPNYWMKDKDGVQLPYLDKVTFKPIPEVAQRVNALETGQIDAMHTSDTEQLAKRLRPDKAAGKVNLLESDKFAEVGYTMLNSGKPPFDNIHARKAVAWASDAQLLIKTRLGGIGQIASGPFAPGVDGYLKDTGTPKAVDLTKAKEETALYKKDTGKDLTFAYTTVGIDSALLTVQEIQTQMAAAGIKMTIATAADQATTINKALSHDFQAIGWRNHPGADPDTQYMWWYSKSALNFGSIKDPELDRLLDAGRGETDPAKRLKDYQDINQLFANNMYNLWGPWALWTIAFSPKVNGILGPTMSVGGNFPGLGSGHFMTGVWLSK
ncbi:MAG: peptide/nickel transport system substrate-binding protein [Actinomycetota bacterium]|nr:peptide/nickel transport system substrate-binding protein [Actinomycetota bacterium]